MAHIKNRGFPLQVRDEHLYTKTIRKCFNNPNAEQINDKQVIIVVKIDTKGNVISSYGKIGELGWDDIDYYFELYGEQEHTTECKLYTRTGELFGAYLSITMGEYTATKLLAKNLPNAELTPKADNYNVGFWARILTLFSRKSKGNRR